LVSIVIVVSVGAPCASVVTVGLSFAVNFAKFDSLGPNSINGVFVVELFTHIFGGIIVSVNNTIEEVGLFEGVWNIEVQLSQVPHLVLEVGKVSLESTIRIMPELECCQFIDNVGDQDFFVASMAVVLGEVPPSKYTIHLVFILGYPGAG
jgi:hypothetical protein